MSTVLSYPSADFPAPVRVSIDCPEDWAPLPEVALPLALAKVVAPGEFRPNVIVVVSRTRKQFTLENAVSEVVTKLTGLAGYAELGREEREIAGHPGFRIEGAFTDAEGGTLVQAVRTTIVDRGPVVDLVQVTGSCSGAQAEQLLVEIRAIQESLRIEA
ncbi:LpqN/LpqT family lipoprotein [Oerskovia enterophila]|uniref:LpqN/LpqT family lipoprotein n=1 Tax=Oerskovia enterophila TaxID=43678 RepID=UPI00339372B8